MPLEKLPADKVNRIAQVLSVSDPGSVALLNGGLIHAVWVYRELARIQSDGRLTISQVRKNLEKKWLRRARALKELADDLDEQTEFWLINGARYPVEMDESGSGVSVPSADEPKVAHLGTHRVEVAIRAVKRLPSYIELALEHLPEERGPPDKNFALRLYLQHLWPFYRKFAGEPTVGGRTGKQGPTGKFVTAALDLIGVTLEGYSGFTQRELIRKALGRVPPKRTRPAKTSRRV